MRAVRQIASKVLSRFPGLEFKVKMALYTKANKKYPQTFPQLTATEQEILKGILQKGYYVLEDYYPAEWCDACVSMVRAAVEEGHDFIKVNEDRRIFGAEALSDDFMKFHNDEMFARLADAYYGKKASIGVTMANWIWFDKNHKFGSGGDWHRDRLRRQFKALVYLTDVTDKTGAFQMIESSNTNHIKQLADDAKVANDLALGNRLTGPQVDKILQQAPERLKTFTAKKGTVVLIDTSAIHRGSPVQEGERFAIFNYYYPVDENNQQWSLKKFSPRVPTGFKLRNQ